MPFRPRSRINYISLGYKSQEGCFAAAAGVHRNMQITKGVYLFGGVGYDSNIYIVDGEVIIDTGTGDYFTEVKNEIVSMGFDPDKIHTILLTHSHFDHTGGCKKFRDWLRGKAIIAVHGNDRSAVEHGETLAEMFGASPRIVTADVSLSDKDVVRTKHFNLEIVHTPGHTPGSICIYDKKRRILFSGDTLFEDGFGRTDYTGGSAEDMVRSLKRLSRLDIEYLLPGHGNPKAGGVKFLIRQILSGSLKVKAVHR